MRASTPDDATRTDGPRADSKNMGADIKIMTDLDTVAEKLDLLDSMLHPPAGEPAPSIATNETLKAVLGFLEACAPRLVELVEVAAQGALSEDVLEKCLGVNDRLTKLLEQVDTLALTESPASTTAASAPAASAAVEEDLLFGSAPAAPVGKSTGDDLFLTESQEEDAQKPVASTPVSNDPFADPFGTESPRAAAKLDDEMDFFS